MTTFETLDAWIGRERVVEDVLSPYPARALAAALDREHLPGVGDTLPPAWQWLYFLDTPAAAATGRDGHPHHGEFLPPAPLPRRMWAAGSFEVARLLRLGESARRHSRIASIEAKHGKTGALVFVTLEHTYSQGGADCIRETQSLVYRDMPTAATPLPPGDAVPEAAFRRELEPDPVLLFRYSALTYNGHRIHYDRDYAQKQEFYPSLVVQGPLLATLLLELLGVSVPDATLRSFAFRAGRPSFDTSPLVLGGVRNGERVDLWSAQDDARCMQATAVLA